MTTTRASRAGDLAGERDHLAVGIVAVGGDHGAVIGDIDGVERASSLKTGADFGEIGVHQAAVDGAVRVAGGDQDRYRLPGSCRVHGFHERGRLANDEGVLGARRLEDGVAFELVEALEISLLGDGGLAIAFEPDADDGDARRCHGWSSRQVGLNGAITQHLGRATRSANRGGSRSLALAGRGAKGVIAMLCMIRYRTTI